MLKLLVQEKDIIDNNITPVEINYKSFQQNNCFLQKENRFLRSKIKNEL